MSRILILGCGELAWGRPSTSPLFGRQWNQGRLSDKVCFEPDGPLPGETPGLDWVTLAEELDRRMAWRPAAALGPAPSIVVTRGEPVSPPTLPAWQELAGIQARWATKELGGAGVLVSPKEWREPIQGRQLFEAWAGESWSWASLEEALQRRFSPDCRFISASGSFLRVMQPEGGLVLANGLEAACAVEMAPAILDRALEQLDPGLASRWRLEEEPESGWYVHQQLVRKLTKALKEGRTKAELGGSSLFRVSGEGRMIIDPRGTSGVLFRFSSAAAQELYQVLSTLRITVEWPDVAVPWWEQVSQPGFLHSAQGISHPGIRWDDRKTVLLEGTEIRQLSSYLAARNLPQEEVDPARLEEALELGSPLSSSPKEAAGKAPTVPAEAPAPRGATAVESAPVRPAEPAAPPPVAAGAAVPKNAVPAADPGLASPRAQPSATPEPGIQETLSQPAQGVGQTGEPEVTALAAFLPHQFSLEVPHRPDRVQVSIDGQLIEQGNVRRSSRQGGYTIEGIAVPHGAIVRVDFDPPQE
jgi:hypothetical protein